MRSFGCSLATRQASAMRSLGTVTVTSSTA